ncbi:MAG: hypothetical protein KGD63_14725 [Candidatus Lokiarchaeota archaeon]|nr:hypothetical protein [Candidatus Lokiarchaeota archaeon]
MNKEKFEKVVEDINEYEGVEEVFLLNNEGEVLFKSKEFPLTNEESKEILDAWKNKKPSITYLNNRYAIIKNDEIQLAAKNIVGGKGNIAGSITKEGDYLIIHTAQETGLILLEWSIFVNKIAWL